MHCIEDEKGKVSGLPGCPYACGESFCVYFSNLPHERTQSCLRLSYPLPKLVQARLATPGVLPYKRMGSGVVLFKFGRLLHCQLIAMVACKIVWLPTLYYFTTYMYPWPWRGEGQKSSTHGRWVVVNRKRKRHYAEKLISVYRGIRHSAIASNVNRVKIANMPFL